MKTAMNQIRSSVTAAGIGRHGQIRIGLSDLVAYSRAAALLSDFKSVASDLDLRFFELPPALQIEWLREDLLDVGFVPSPAPTEGIVAEPVWKEAVLVALPQWHRLALMETVSLSELADAPLLLFESGADSYTEHCGLNLDLFERSRVAGKVNSVGVLAALIVAGHGIGFATAQQMSSASSQGIALRPLKEADLTLTTYLIRPEGLLSEAAARFFDWTRQSDSVQKLPLLGLVQTRVTL